MQTGASFRLIVRRGPQPNQVYELTRETITIGRDVTNDIVINDPEVSRHHTRMIRTGSGYTIEDLRSTNGTFVNRQRLTGPYTLTNGDLIGLGETVTLAYEVAAGAGVAATMPGASAAPAVLPAYAPAPPPVSTPVADEEDYRPDRNRWIVIGCGILTLIFCCLLVGGVIAVDQLSLWCDLPFAEQVFDCTP